uniref:Reverse transcriptase zinc-binding domain-containing protein n=1 Tax=Cajanus cajan TaxID=3821 RepID=A0A151TZV5_CAJCA|nr:hypothetical protein KK1_005104 [Cajanus cajan]
MIVHCWLVGETDVPYFFWSIPAPPKVHYFMWRLVNSDILIVDNLIRRNITLKPQQTLCPFCKSDTETVSHIFCTCPCLWGISFVGSFCSN